LKLRNCLALLLDADDRCGLDVIKSFRLALNCRTTLSGSIAHIGYGMAVSTTPLEKPLNVLSSIMAGEANPSNSSASPYGDILSSLKRIKHALIGNTSRKIDLASRSEDVAR
jgi:hypothetical protein